MSSCSRSRYQLSGSNRSSAARVQGVQGRLQLANRTVEIARDIHGMILFGVVGADAESPGSTAAGQGVTQLLKPLAYRRGAGDRYQDQGDEVAGVSHSFLTD
jgi:hypothetical protein